MRRLCPFFEAEPVRSRDAQIRALYMAGVPYRKIAAQVGMSLGGVYRICQEKLDLPERRRRAVIRPIDRHIEKLFHDGLTYQAIGDSVGMSKTGVYRICQEKLRLPRRPAQTA